jgi:CDP-glycerol glycerophosphotransferase (TagB/SpsB family)
MEEETLLNDSLLWMMSCPVACYIDPGTGAMLFSVVMGVVTAAYYFIQRLVLKLKFFASGGRAKRTSGECLPYVIFSDSKRYWNVFKPICDEFEKRKIQVEYWTASPDDPALNEKYEYVTCKFIGEGSRAYAKLNMMNAQVCLATTPGLDVYQWKRTKTPCYYVHIVHEIGEVIMYRMFGLDYYDAVLTSGDFHENDIRKIEHLRGISAKEIYPVGSTYMDSMQDRLDKIKQAQHGHEDACNNIIKEDNPADTLSSVNVTNTTADAQRTIILAPTWGTSSILNRFGKRFIKSLVDTGYNIIIRPHPQTAISDPELLDELKKAFPENDKLSWNSDNDNFDVLNKGDVLISDFSGVIFDYALIFDKPIIYTDTKLDLSPYDAAWIDEPIWRKKVLPELGIELREEDFSNMKSIIDELIANEKYQAGRDRVRNEAWKYKGEAAIRTVDYLVDKHKELYGEAS